jgi:hypothetical protein
MARKYSRDAKGRFASSGSGGATARGSRIKAAAGGEKRERSTIGTPVKRTASGVPTQAATSGPAGTIGGTRKLRVAQRAKRIGGIGALPNAERSLKRQAAAVRGGKTRKANLEATPLSKRSKSYQAKRAKAGFARGLRPF